MIRLISSLREGDMKTYKEFLEPSAQKYQLYLFQAVTKKEAADEPEAKKYNLAVQAMFGNNMAEPGDLVGFIHEDIGIVDSLFKEKIHAVFNKRPDIGMLGVLGSNQISDSFEWWMNPPEHLRGHIIQGTSDNPGKGEHLVKGLIGFYDDIVSIDKNLMIVRSEILKEIQFDDEIFTINELYNTDFCLQVLEMGYKIAVADILIHQANQPKNESKNPVWQETRLKAIAKWSKYKLPITINSFDDIDKKSQNGLEVMELTI